MDLFNPFLLHLSYPISIHLFYLNSSILSQYINSFIFPYIYPILAQYVYLITSQYIYPILAHISHISTSILSYLTYHISIHLISKHLLSCSSILPYTSILSILSIYLSYTSIKSVLWLSEYIYPILLQCINPILVHLFYTPLHVHINTCILSYLDAYILPSGNLREFLKIHFNVQGVPKNMGIQWRIRYSLCCELTLQYLISKALILLCLLKCILWKGQKTAKMCLMSILSP